MKNDNSKHFIRVQKNSLRKALLSLHSDLLAVTDRSTASFGEEKNLFCYSIGSPKGKHDKNFHDHTDCKVRLQWSSKGNKVSNASFNAPRVRTVIGINMKALDFLEAFTHCLHNIQEIL